jgi:hypothetical protein
MHRRASWWAGDDAKKKKRGENKDLRLPQTWLCNIDCEQPRGRGRGTSSEEREIGRGLNGGVRRMNEISE